MAGVAIGGTKVLSPRSRKNTPTHTASALDMTTSINSSEVNLVSQPKSDLRIDTDVPEEELSGDQVGEINTMVSKKESYSCVFGQ